MREKEGFTVNKSKAYLLPLFDVYLNLKYVDDIINTYIFVEEDEIPKFSILYKFNPEFDFINDHESGYIFYETELTKNSFFISKIDINDYILFVFEVPKDLMYEVSCFLEGKYSWFRKHKKLEIIEFLNKHFSKVPTAVNTVIQVLNKSKSLKTNLETQLNISIPDDVELSSKIDKKKETFYLSKF